MIKKITAADGAKIPKKIKNLKQLRKQKLKEQARDTFEHTAKDDTTSLKKTYPSDCDNLRFQPQKLQFFPKDIEKMKTMSVEERIAYKRQLKKDKQYNIIEDSQD